MTRLLLATIFSFFLSVCAFGGNIKGSVLDATTKEALIGATISVKEIKQGAAAELDGSFQIKNLKIGNYTVVCSFLGYVAQEQKITVKEGATTTVNFLLIEDKKQLSEVVVKGSFEKESDESARSFERRAENLVNVVSAKTIQISPDITVANVIQRVSGISIERNSNGDGQHAILRGMDKRYNYTLVNGVKIPSPDNKYRYVPLDIFPAELLDRLEVTKSLTPNMEGDAVGGAINLVMKNAPDRLYVSANLATGFSELFTNQSYTSFNSKSINFKSPYEQNGDTYNATVGDFPANRVDFKRGMPPPNLVGGLALGNRFLDGRLGVIVAGSYQNTYRGSNSLFFSSDNVGTENSATLKTMSERQFSEQQQRYGLHAKADFKLNSRHSFQWYNAFLNLSNVQTRETKDTQLSFGYQPQLGNANLSFGNRARLTKQTILNSTLQGEHLLGNDSKIQWSAVYSLATNDLPDNTSLTLLGAKTDFQDKITYASSMNRRWEHNSDSDLAAYLNFTQNVKVGGTRLELMAGGLYRYKTRTNFFNSYNFVPVNAFTTFGQDFQNYPDINWRLLNPRGSVATALSYDATEKIAAGYGQFKFEVFKTQFVGGLRVEATDQGYAMLFPIGEDRPTGSQVYTDLLPSLNVKYMPRPNHNVRASYFRSLNRPGFFEIVPYRVVNEEFTERGNPDLKRALADNLDLRYEFFPRPNEQFMVGLFYKSIQNPIEYTLQPDALRGQDIYYTPGNFGNATNYGLEIDAIKYYHRWGLKGNYTFTSSSITTSKTVRIRDENGNLKAIQQSQTRPLYGQSRHIANLTLLYKDAQRGWDAQVAASYTGKRINTVSQFLENDLWQAGFVQMDASVEKSFKNKITVFLKATNLLNTPSLVFIQNTNPKNADVPNQPDATQTLIRRDFYQRSYLLGLRYKL